MSAHLPAFPIPLNNGEAYTTHAPCDGLTKRELIAAMAMQGLASVAYDGGTLSPADIVRLDVSRAVMYADALLAELAKEPQA